jgi:hypothetical protein
MYSGRADLFRGQVVDDRWDVVGLFAGRGRCER